MVKNTGFLVVVVMDVQTGYQSNGCHYTTLKKLTTRLTVCPAQQSKRVNCLLVLCTLAVCNCYGLLGWDGVDWEVFMSANLTVSLLDSSTM